MLFNEPEEVALNFLGFLNPIKPSVPAQATVLMLFNDA